MKMKNSIGLLLFFGVHAVMTLPAHHNSLSPTPASAADGRTHPRQTDDPKLGNEKLYTTQLKLNTEFRGQNTDGLKDDTKTHKRRKRRKKGDSLSQLKNKLHAQSWSKETAVSTTIPPQAGHGNEVRNRKRRWDYDDDYEWEDGGKDYEVPGEESKPDSKFEKIAKNWQKYALKYIFVGSFGLMIVCCCCACCRKICTRTYEIVCWHCKDWRDLCLCRDPAWRKARKFADDYGLQLDYDQYKNIKKSYETSLKNQGYGDTDLSGRK